MRRYRALKPFPEVLVYRNARLLLRQWDSAWSVPVLAYVKEADSGSFVILIRGAGASTVEKQLEEGFSADNSAAERLMDGLVAKGYAEQLA